MKHCDPSFDLSVVVPVLNEQNALPSLFAVLETQGDLSVEIVFSDGGSSDATIALIKRYRDSSRHRVVLVHTEQGRGRQLNHGARQSRGDWVLFLHADSYWSQTDLFSQAVCFLNREAEANDMPVAGHFSLKFSGESFRPRFYRYLSEKAALGLPGTILGDQGLLLKRDVWVGLQGYDESLPVLEDVELVDRIMACGRMVRLPGTLTTSSRRYEHDGVWRRQFFNAVLLLLYATGQNALLPMAMGSYRNQYCGCHCLLAVLKEMLQLPLSDVGRFWYGCGSVVVRYLWVIPFRLYWWGGNSPHVAQGLVQRWNVTIAKRLDCRFWHILTAILLAVLFYLAVLLFLPWCAGYVFRRRLSD